MKRAFYIVNITFIGLMVYFLFNRTLGSFFITGPFLYVGTRVIFHLILFVPAFILTLISLILFIVACRKGNKILASQILLAVASILIIFSLGFTAIEAISNIVNSIKNSGNAIESLGSHVFVYTMSSHVINLCSIFVELFLATLFLILMFTLPEHRKTKTNQA